MKRRRFNSICALVLTGMLTAGCIQMPAAQEQTADVAAEDTVLEADEADTVPEADEADTIPEADEADALPEADEADTVPEADEEDIAKKAAGGHPWIDSQAKENIYEGMPLSPKDDFNLYVNYDFMMSRKKGEKPDASKDVISQDVKELLEADTANSHEEELVQTYYKAFTDWEARNKAGLEPLRSVVEDIHGISSFDEWNEFLCDPDRSGVVPMLLRIMKFVSDEEPTHYQPVLYFRGYAELLLTDPGEYENPSEKARLKLEAAQKEIVHDLTALGWSEEEAVKTFEDYHAVETQLAPELYSLKDVMLKSEKIEPEVVSDISEIQEWMKAYPISEMLSARGYTGTEYVQSCESYMKAVGKIHTQENLELLKNYHIVSFLLHYDSFCDEETFLLSDQVASAADLDNYEKPEDYNTVFQNLQVDLSNALTKAYVERYDLSKEKQALKDFFEELRDIYREMLAEEEWLSEETREKAIEKLDAMKFFSLYPDQFKDYSALDFKDKSIAEIKMALDRFNEQDAAATCRDEVVPELYVFEKMPALEENAMGIPYVNAFIFTIGMTRNSGYTADMRLEDFYANIGCVIGHEMSHCFDENGSLFDKDGLYNDWWTPEDKAAFEARIQKVVDYFDNITVFEGVNCTGQFVSAEATADITGVQAILKLAKTKEGFDYDRFFQKFAEAQAFDSSYERDLFILEDDTHPLNYLRTNVVLQQFDEFLETYDVKEGDGMYLAPEDRILVW